MTSQCRAIWRDCCHRGHQAIWGELIVTESQIHVSTDKVNIELKYSGRSRYRSSLTVVRHTYVDRRAYVDRGLVVISCLLAKKMVFLPVTGHCSGENPCPRRSRECPWNRVTGNKIARQLSHSHSMANAWCGSCTSQLRELETGVGAMCLISFGTSAYSTCIGCGAHVHLRTWDLIHCSSVVEAEIVVFWSTNLLAYNPIYGTSVNNVTLFCTPITEMPGFTLSSIGIDGAILSLCNVMNTVFTVIHDTQQKQRLNPCFSFNVSYIIIIWLYPYQRNLFIYQPNSSYWIADIFSWQLFEFAYIRNTFHGMGFIWTHKMTQFRQK